MTDAAKPLEPEPTVEQAEDWVEAWATDGPLQEVREKSVGKDAGTIIEASDGRRYKVGYHRRGYRFPSLKRLHVPGEDTTELQREANISRKITKAVEKFARQGLGDNELDTIREQATLIARAKPVDVSDLLAKEQAVLDLMLSMILRGELLPKSAAEATKVAADMAQLIRVTNVDIASLGVAIAAEATATASEEDHKRRYQEILTVLNERIGDQTEMKRRPE